MFSFRYPLFVPMTNKIRSHIVIALHCKCGNANTDRGKKIPPTKQWWHEYILCGFSFLSFPFQNCPDPNENSYNGSHLFILVIIWCFIGWFFSLWFRFVSFTVGSNDAWIQIFMFDDYEAAKIFMTLITLQRGQRLNYSPTIISISTNHELTSKQINAESD